MVTNMFPNLFNFTGVNLYDLIQMAVTVILAVAVITVSINAGKLNDETLESNKKIADLAKKYMEQGSAMRQTEINLAVSKQIIEIYNFFVRDIFANSFFNKENEELMRGRCNEILFQSSFLFNQEICGVIEKSVRRIRDVYATGMPSYTPEEYERAKEHETAGIQIKIYEAFMNRESEGETIRNYESNLKYEGLLKKTVFLYNIREDIAAAFSCFKFNLGPEPGNTL